MLSWLWIADRFAGDIRIGSEDAVLAGWCFQHRCGLTSIRLKHGRNGPVNPANAQLRPYRRAWNRDVYGATVLSGAAEQPGPVMMGCFGCTVVFFSNGGAGCACGGAGHT